jgi:4-diphosphocytidyl-2-C-methyl-D-erythritol kinase
VNDGRPPASDRETAPAKINLALAVTGRRDDGYHRLDTLVVHGVVGDTVGAVVRGAPRRGVPPRIRLDLTGPFAAGLAAEPDNLVLRAARLLADEAAAADRPIADVDLTLDKHLPIASGIGGGSSDAAATLRLLDRLWRLDLGGDRLAALSLRLGADLPMCLGGRPARARGIGEEIEPITGFPELTMVLVNPGVAVSTPAVFRALENRDNPPLRGLGDGVPDLEALVGRLADERNDLEPAAIGIAAVIGEAIGDLGDRPGCRLARMSGSGATVFGLFDDLDAAATAVADLRRRRPQWWAVAGRTIGSPG